MRRYLPALLTLLFGLLVHFTVPGYAFAGLLICALSLPLFAYRLLRALLPRFPVFSRVMNRVLTALLILVSLLTVATGIWIGSAARGTQTAEADYVIVLGAGVNGTQPSGSLADRLRAAQAYLEEYPQAIAVLSGGQGDGEDISEAQCMYNWLTAAGISPQRLRLEERATSTEENIRYSMELIYGESGEKPQQTAVVTSEYHLARACLHMKAQGVEMLGYPAKTSNRLYFCNMFLREIFGIWHQLLRPNPTA